MTKTQWIHRLLICATIACLLVIGCEIQAAYAGPASNTSIEDPINGDPDWPDLKFHWPHWLYTPGGWFWWMM